MHVNPIGGDLGPLTRTLTHLVERGRRRPASTRWVQLCMSGLRVPVDGPGCQVHGATHSPVGIPRLLVREKTRPTRPLQPHFREKTRPAHHKTPILSHFSCAGRTFSRTRRDNVATLKPTTPLLTHNKAPLKPPSPLRPKTAPKTPISHPQRRWRFHSHTRTSEQRRRWFQTTGPHGRQGQAAVPAGPEAMSGPAISHLVSLTRTLTR